MLIFIFLMGIDFEEHSYFGINTEKQTYLELCEQYSHENAVGQKMLTMALMRRCIATVERIMKIQEDKPALSNLVKQGVLSEELLNKLEAAEQELDSEVNEIFEEADFYRPGWRQSIFKEASQLVQRKRQLEAEQQAQAMTSSSKNQEKSKELSEEEQEELRKKLEQELVKEEEKQKNKATKKKRKSN